MISPRTRFQEKAKQAGWRWLDVIDSEQFLEAATAAMLEMQLTNSAAPDMASAAAWQWRGDGAKQFLHILMTLLEKPQELKPMDTANLNWKA